MSIGIDYGMGKTNIDTSNGVRYGVISQQSLASWFYDSFEPDYGEATCPKCGNPARDASTDASTAEQMEETDEYESLPGCSDYACDECRITFDSSEAFSEEPIGFNLEEDGYKAIGCLDSDVMLLASPFYTYAPFCSPCVPGAGNLNDALEPGDKEPGQVGTRTYCFSHDWFEDGKAPYRVFRVADDTEVLPEAK